MPGENCSVGGCGSCRRTKGIGIWKLPYPRNEEYRKWRHVWLNQIKKTREVDDRFQQLIDLDRVYTCEKHFAYDDIEVFESKKMIKKKPIFGAIPTLNMPDKSQVTTRQIVKNRSIVKDNQKATTRQPSYTNFEELQMSFNLVNSLSHGNIEENEDRPALQSYQQASIPQEIEDIVDNRMEEDWMEYQCKSGQTMVIYNKVTGEHNWPHGLDQRKEYKIIHGHPVTYKEFSTTATQTDDNGCNNGCMSMHINTDTSLVSNTSDATLPQQQPSVSNGENGCLNRGPDPEITVKLENTDEQCNNGCMSMYASAEPSHVSNTTDALPLQQQLDVSDYENCCVNSEPGLEITVKLENTDGQCNNNGCVSMYNTDPSHDHNTNSETLTPGFLHGEHNYLNNEPCLESNFHQKERQWSGKIPSYQNNLVKNSNDGHNYSMNTIRDHQFHNQKLYSISEILLGLDKAKKWPCKDKSSVGDRIEDDGGIAGGACNLVKKESDDFYNKYDKGIDDIDVTSDKHVCCVDSVTYNDDGKGVVRGSVNVTCDDVDDKRDISDGDSVGYNDVDDRHDVSDSDNIRYTDVDDKRDVSDGDNERRNNVKDKHDISEEYEVGSYKKEDNHESLPNDHMQICNDNRNDDNMADTNFTRMSFEVPVRANTGKETFQCSYCKKTFSQKGNLRKHIRIHTNEKPFGCTVCKRNFTHKHHLVSHIRTHTGEKPFQCTLCKRKFSQSQQVKVHLRSHTGEKPFECTVCKRRFKRRLLLKQHTMIHTG